MQQGDLSIVVTSIFHPGKALRSLAEGAFKNKWNLIIVGDVSSPHDFHLEHATYYDIAKQRQLTFRLAKLCPERHYTRKNLGYLIAMDAGSKVIVETDDDNIPLPTFWQYPQAQRNSAPLTGKGWANVYSVFTTNQIWPRGLPLEELHAATNFTANLESHATYSPVQQGLADENPDVDAVFRMTCNLPVTFENQLVCHLVPGLWSPFNSQNTCWFADAFLLLYLPSFCTFRMTDIWRSFVAQRIMWTCDWNLLFYPPTVVQERNEHNLLKDFEQEVPGYLHNNKIKRILEDLDLMSGKKHIAENMMRCYTALVDRQIITDVRELTLLEAWINDVQMLADNGGKNR